MRNLASNAVSIAVVKGAPLATRVLLLLSAARVATPDDFARASYAVAVAEALRVVGDLGMETWAVRAIGQSSDPVRAARTTSAVAVAKLLFGTLAAIAAALITLWTGHSDASLALVAALFVLGGQAFGVGVIHSLSRGSPGWLVPVCCISAVAILTVGLISLSAGASPTQVCAIIAVGDLLAAVYVLGTLIHARALKWYPGILAESIAVARAALPSAGYSATVAIYTRLDALALISFSAAVYASYNVALRVIQPFNFIFGAIALAIYSARVRTLGHKGSAAEFSVRKPIATLFAAGCLAALISYAVCGQLIASFVPAYADSLPVLRLLCVLLPLYAVNNVSTYLIAGHGRFHAVLAVAILNLASTAVLLAALVPRYGAIGAAMALVGCESLSCVVQFSLLARLRSGNSTGSNEMTGGWHEERLR